MMTIYDLPNIPTDIFLIVSHFLNPIDIVRCRAVSKAWHKVFTDASLLRGFLIRRYKAREVRLLLSQENGEIKGLPCLSSDMFMHAWTLSPEAPIEAQRFGSVGIAKAWIYAFDKVAARYFALESGRPHYITKEYQNCHLPNLLGGDAGKPFKIRYQQVPVGQ